MKFSSEGMTIEILKSLGYSGIDIGVENYVVLLKGRIVIAN
jgi:hypothetical protein